MATNITMFLIVITLTSVAAQTFQYSRGWTNGKRDGHKTEDIRDLTNNLERILSPCQMNKLKYVLEGKPLNERLLGPCDTSKTRSTTNPSDTNTSAVKTPCSTHFNKHCYSFSY
uniref:Pro-corazonin n=1 Tax=Galleria mellonella TaxID=7137 RepID=CORZ_GALME|nr:RecName: Full=Pro-corazonin; Short=Crz; Contains: RecName: Full=Corazonin; Contains: RecName: Full=Corazonin precursor-related peptide; Short=CPRP; Flags: Precursor [Galleria mellonella]AAF87082.1 corazonin precursor [Galleria mellonella]